jgi:hypothetical protein
MNDRSRRAFLKRASAVAIGVGVAGCSGQTGGGTETGGGGAADGTGTAQAGGANQTATEPDATEQATGTAAGESQSVEGSVATEKMTDGLQITEHNFFVQGDVAGVEGVLKNTSQKTFEYAEVKVSPVDESGQEVGQFFSSTKAQNVDSLAPGETWNFVVSFSSNWVEKFDRYEIWATGVTQTSASEGNGTSGNGTNQTQMRI